MEVITKTGHYKSTSEFIKDAVKTICSKKRPEGFNLRRGVETVEELEEGARMLRSLRTNDNH
jgi:Arc/MetJ-type ribon-helix-helix transcriptional regulator